MKSTRRLLLLTFVESVATVCVERGVFFFAHLHLSFGESANLWLALSFGASYVAGALSSHELARRLDEKNLLRLAIGGQMLTHLALTAFGSAPVWLFVLNALIGFLNGLKWPVIESYVSAGRDAGDSAVTIGHFNLSWASAVPLSLVLVGPLNTFWSAGLFLVPAVLNLTSLALVVPLPSAPEHTPDSHPSRTDAPRLATFGVLLASSRWLMLFSYAGMWIVSALIPSVLARLHVSDALAPAVAAVLDVSRVAVFVGMRSWRGWIGCPWMLLLACAALPLSFLGVLLSTSLAGLLAGELVFGLAAGSVYYAAIFYAMVVKNASVDAGGGHEALIGGGFTLGPFVGLVALRLVPVFDSRLLGTLAGVGPLAALCIVGAVLPLARMIRSKRSLPDR